ncbi:swr1 complex component [Pestalotiopsis sp. IQ-011]
MASPSNRPRVDVRAAMPGGFPDYCEQPDRRAVQSSGMTLDTETTSSRSSDRPAPSKGILKSSSTMASQNPLAARFSRAGRQDQMHHSPTYPPVPFGQDDNWPYDSYDSYEQETDSQSVSSELSTISTQATSVASDETVTDMSCPPSGHFKHIRHVPPPVVARVKARPRAHNPTTEMAKSPPQKRQVNIQIFPPGSAASHGQGRELQLSRKTERDLLDKIDELQNQAVSLREVRAHLNKELAEANDKLSIRAHEAKDLQKSLSHERNSKEQLSRDLQAQRTQLDEKRSNLQLQKGMLDDAEHERDAIRGARDHLEKHANKLERDMTTQKTQHKELEAILIQKAADLRQSTKSFENKVATQEKQLKDLEAQRQFLQKTVESQDKQLSRLQSLTTERDTLKSNLERQQTVHADIVKTLMSERDAFKTQLEAQEKQLKELNDLTCQRDSLKAKISILVSENTALTGDKERLEQSESKLKDLVKARGEKNSNLAKRIGELEGEIQTFKGEIDTFSTQIKESENAKKELEAQLEESETKSKEAVDAEKDNTQKLVAAEKTKLEDMETQAAADKAELESRIASLETELQGAKDANVVIVSERLEIKTKLDKVNETLTTTEGEVKNLEERNKNLESAIETTTAQVAALDSTRAELDQLSQQHKELEGRAEGLQADIDQQAKGAAALQADKDQLASDRAELDALKAKMEDASAITKLIEEKAGLESQVKSLDTETEGLKAQEIKLKGEIESLKTEADKVPTLMEQHRTVSAQLGAALQDLAQARAAVDMAGAQVRDLQAQAAKLRARPKERSGSRPKKHDRSRSTGLVFVRSPSDKGTGVYVTTRDALKTEQG